MSEINIDASVAMVIWHIFLALFMVGCWSTVVWLAYSKSPPKIDSRKCAAPNCQCLWPTDCPAFEGDPAERIYRDGFVEHTKERKDSGC